MLHIRTIIFVFLALPSAALSQAMAPETLRIEQTFWGVNYFKGSAKITHEEFGRALRSSPDSTVFEEYTSGKNTTSIANVFGFAGGFCVGYGLSSTPSNTALTIVGAIAIVGGLIVEGRGNAEIERAITRYNRIESGRQPASGGSLGNEPSLGVTISFRL